MPARAAASLPWLDMSLMILAATTPPAPAAAAAAADTFPWAFVVGALVTITVQLVMGGLQLRATWRLTHRQLKEQRVQLKEAAVNARSAELRTLQSTAALAFTKACHDLVAAAGAHSTTAQPPGDPVVRVGIGGYDEWVNQLPGTGGIFSSADKTLKGRASAARTALEDVRLAFGPELANEARELYRRAVDLAGNADSLAAVRHRHPNVQVEDDSGIYWEESPEVGCAKEGFRQLRKEYGDQRREFTALFQREVWGVSTRPSPNPT